MPHRPESGRLRCQRGQHRATAAGVVPDQADPLAAATTISRFGFNHVRMSRVTAAITRSLDGFHRERAARNDGLSAGRRVPSGSARASAGSVGMDEIVGVALVLPIFAGTLRLRLSGITEESYHVG